MSINNDPQLSAQEALEALTEGNKRFLTGQPQHPRQDAARRGEVLDGQAPFAVVITCSDSRVPPEIFFDQGIGDIFVVRTAGNVLDDVALGSVEYAVEHLKVPLVLVVGHQKCGAVSAVASGGELSGHLVDIGREIEPAVAKAKTMQGDLVANAIDENIRNTAGRLIASEPVLAEFVKASTLKIASARYDLDTGQVVFLSE
jgi:carbonic anhydrase